MLVLFHVLEKHLLRVFHRQRRHKSLETVIAHVILTLEPDPKIRRSFVQRARDLLSSDSELQIDSAESRELAVFWAWGGQAPIGFSQNPEGCCLLLGYAIDDRDRKLDQNLLLKEWTEQTAVRESWNGYFASLRYTESAGLAVDVDPLGFFPMFFYHHNGILIAGSSGALFEAHPRFQSQLDPVGLAGILLTNGLVNEQTLLKNVRQLSAGHRLFRSPEGLVSEVRTWQFDVPARIQHRSFNDTVSSVSDEFESAIKRHQPVDCETTLMLSGGLDSRLMGGYLHQLGVDFTATIFGKPTDFEVRAARRVASLLGIPHVEKTTEITSEELVSDAFRTAHKEHLTHGFVGVQPTPSSVGTMSPMFWSGYFLDDILGGYAAGYAWDDETHQLSFETYFRKLNRWGIDLETLKKLMRPALTDAAQLVDSLVDDLRAIWNQYEGSDSQKSFQMKLATRGQYHLAGALHRMFFSSWPLTPCLDTRFLRRMLEVPLEVSFRRRLEYALLHSNCPSLAALPFDTNSFRFENSTGFEKRSPLSPRKLWLSTRKAFRSWYWLKWRMVEPRRYRRFYDPDQTDWRIIRRAAEPHRQELGRLLDHEELARLVPSPEVDLNYSDPFAEGASFRNLCGLMLWNASTGSQATRAA